MSYTIREVGGMTFRYNWSLFVWGREYCCGVVSGTQESTKKEGKTQAGLRRGVAFHTCGKKKEKGRTPQEGQPAMGW